MSPDLGVGVEGDPWGRGSVLCGHAEVSWLFLKNRDTIKYGSRKGALRLHVRGPLQTHP